MIEELGGPGVAARLRGLRLLYAARVARGAPLLLRALLQNDGAGPLPWLRMLASDVAAIVQRVAPKLDELPVFAEDPEPWAELWRNFPGQRAALVRRACGRPWAGEQQPGVQPAPPRDIPCP